MHASKAHRLLEDPMAMGEYMAKHWREHAPADVLARYDAAVGDRAAMEAALADDGWLTRLHREIRGRQICARWAEGPNGRYCQQQRTWGLSEAATLEAHKQLQHRLWLTELDDNAARPETARERPAHSEDAPRAVAHRAAWGSTAAAEALRAWEAAALGETD